MNKEELYKSLNKFATTRLNELVADKLEEIEKDVHGQVSEDDENLDESVMDKKKLMSVMKRFNDFNSFNGLKKALKKAVEVMGMGDLIKVDDDMVHYMSKKIKANDPDEFVTQFLKMV